MHHPTGNRRHRRCEGSGIIELVLDAWRTLVRITIVLRRPRKTIKDDRRSGGGRSPGVGAWILPQTAISPTPKVPNAPSNWESTPSTRRRVWDHRVGPRCLTDVSQNHYGLAKAAQDDEKTTVAPAEAGVQGSGHGYCPKPRYRRPLRSQMLHPGASLVDTPGDVWQQMYPH